MEPATSQKNTAMAILAYIGPLVFVSYIVAKDDEFVNFHIRQGLVVFTGLVCLLFLEHILFPLRALFTIAQLALIVLIAIGVYNASQGEEKELPFVGKYSEYFPVK